MWERACSRRRCVSQRMYQLILRFREQARSHIARSHKLNDRKFCRIGLSRVSCAPVLLPGNNFKAQLFKRTSTCQFLYFAKPCWWVQVSRWL
ncbi:hypothetical protein FFI16_028235 [Pseudomonas sp. KBS0710]|nr:hypothetical protein FFI16_028235 [Pseudomonas sp. KBS0710]